VKRSLGSLPQIWTGFTIRSCTRRTRTSRYPELWLSSSSGFWATPTAALGAPVMIAYVAPAIAAPMMGATMNNQT
jgi:hypothetical protein